MQSNKKVTVSFRILVLLCVSYIYMDLLIEHTYISSIVISSLNATFVKNIIGHREYNQVNNFISEVLHSSIMLLLGQWIFISLEIVNLFIQGCLWLCNHYIWSGNYCHWTSAHTYLYSKIIYQDASTFHLIAKVFLCCKPICY